MVFRCRFLFSIVTIVVFVLQSSPSQAQIEDQLAAYTGVNATGYLQPLADALGANLNSGLYNTAHIPVRGLRLRLEVRLMSVLFSDDDKTFKAVTESGFTPQKKVEVPTVVGPTTAMYVDGDSGTSFAFPGGFDLSSFAFAAPQVRIGAVFGTEALFRYFSFNTGDVELGNLSLFGFGIRHNLSQYLGHAFPVNIAGGFFWQRFALGENKGGDDLISTQALSMGIQASKRFLVIEPYAGLSMDKSSTELTYESEATGEEETIEIDFEEKTTLHLTLGLSLNFKLLHLQGEYSMAGQNSFSLGLAFGI